MTYLDVVDTHDASAVIHVLFQILLLGKDTKAKYTCTYTHV